MIVKILKFFKGNKKNNNMATAALPLAFEAAQIAIPLIKSLIDHINKHTNPAPDAATLHQTVTNSVQPVVNLLTQTGALPTGIDPNTLSAMIQTLIQEMSPSAPVAPKPTTVVIPENIPGGPAPDVILNNLPAPPINPFPPGTKFQITGTITV